MRSTAPVRLQDTARARARLFLLLGAAALALAAAWLGNAGELVAKDSPGGGAGGPGGGGGGSERAAATTGKCVTCHKGIEEMHPWAKIGCADCHGGDPDATEKEKAHVAATKTIPNDERVLPANYDLPFLRFRNPTNLRVAAQTCGTCHKDQCEGFFKSLHCTTAGHLSDGFYENGLTKEKRSFFGVFPIADDRAVAPSAPGDPAAAAAAPTAPPTGALKSLAVLPAFLGASTNRDRIQTHFPDVPRKNCVRCHFWSQGLAVRGRLGMDGDYRAEGCAGCHVLYTDQGLSRSLDKTIKKFEPGHPLKHRMSSVVPTTTCVHCHYGDASIGLHFRGMAMLVPGQPAGPDVPGTTPMRLNGQFYMRDDKVTPPDVHYQKGMHCVDCHTGKDLMGDGGLYGAMEHGIEIECVSCHGTIKEETDLKTVRGRPLPHLTREDGKVVLRSKVDGKEHVVKQVKNVVDPKHPDYNARAAKAMTAAHDRLECYACHSGWNSNFFGFHFDRNESFNQLDLLTGERTPGRVNTLEKVFATFKQLYLGFNSEGMIAPYLTGFSTFCTVHDGKGRIIVDQRMPETAAGLSGMTMVHHQMHTVRPQARGCVECHRSSTTWGLGSPSFSLTRDFAFLGTSAGMTILAIDRKNPEKSIAAAIFPAPPALDVVLAVDPIQGHGQVAYLCCGTEGVVVADVSNPLFPRRLGKFKTVNARSGVLAGKHLLLADGTGGLKILDVSNPAKLALVRAVEMKDAHALSLSGLYAFVADGPGGLAIVDLADVAQARVVASASTSREKSELASDATHVATYFQYSRPTPDGKRTRAQNLALVADSRGGALIFDVTEPVRPLRLSTFLQNPNAERFVVKGLAVGSKFDLGSEGGKIPSEEHDYAWAVVEEKNKDDDPRGYLRIFRITDPRRPQGMGASMIQNELSAIAVLRTYNAPFLTYFALAVGPGTTEVIDVTKPGQPSRLAQVPGLAGAKGIAVESFCFDRTLDEDGKPLKDISHEGARYLTRDELVRILRVQLHTEESGPRK
ncbi:MAG: hypothetical protein HYZ53_28130 [Planctomycetes bacterium]|nr:hypothetical protein [Planctomycetota bacterium]